MWRKAERRLIDDQCSWMGLKPTVAATDLQRTMQTHTKYKREIYAYNVFGQLTMQAHSLNIAIGITNAGIRNLNTIECFSSITNLF